VRCVFLVTVHRRYHELRQNLLRSRELALAELGYAPDVVLVWADPEISRTYFIRELMAEGLVTHLIRRAKLPGEGSAGGTSYPESVNIRQGLEFIRHHYACRECGNQQHVFVVMHAADIWLQDGVLKLLQKQITDGHHAVVFHWNNGCANADVWHTNFFGVSLSSEWWPPVSSPEHQDVLERQWGKVLEGRPSVGREHNSNDRKFIHRHQSETLPALPRYPEHISDCISISCSGSRTWWQWLEDGLREQGQKWWDWFGGPAF
jgi:hypothetical protein